MSEYILTALRFDQILEQDDKGRVVKRIRHRQGALITDLDDIEAQRLLGAGAIRPADLVDDALEEEAEASEPSAATPESPADPAADAPRRPRATATIEKWIAYAQAVGVNVDGLTDKDAVIAKVDAADD
ncbi:lipase chaperone [Rhodococcus hoagii]|uniref:lipase chaperone n=1 Tax=Rhodococcus hoagii TaxID=43767 RepID=UPI00198006CB|nr:lipase chaperone [Prescottella equi]MBM4548537.1 lipase chaperone [Prescottella equi]MBM4710906.1 lipase chaperone [Prescottella equi]MBP0086134.1 lipase chaperone [Prescottella equi]NKT29899.1 lipase chaperone [Prescottella equi]NKT99635.1 lipase chaperone [Prescottella equi]